MTLPRLLDTSTLSHYVGRRAREKSPALVEHVESIIASDGPRVSVVTLYELERGLRKLELKGEGAHKRRMFTMFLADTAIFGLDTHHGRAWYIAAELHARAASHKPAIAIDEGDLLILATAIAHQHAVATSDVAFAEHAGVLGYGLNVEHVPFA